MMQKTLEDILNGADAEAKSLNQSDETKMLLAWREHWMPTVDFYKLVYENGGVVEPKDFENYENLL